MKLDGTLLEFMKVEARKSIRKRRFNEALGYYKRISDITPNDPTVWWMRGNVLGWTGNMEQAIESFQHALELRPDYAEAHCSLGNALCCQKRLQEAVEHYHRALALKPEYPEAQHNLATALHSIGRSDEAETLYRSALSTRPTADLYYNLANTVLQLGRTDEAMTYYEEALLLDPRFVPAHLNLGNAFYHASRLQEAETCYREVLRLQPKHLDGLFNLASTLENQGRLDEALEYYEKTLELSPGHVRATAGKASILEKRGDSAGAAALLQPLLDSKVEWACIANVMANVCRHTGGRERITDLLERLLQRDPDTMDPREHLILHFSLGRLMDEAGRYDEAFEYYRDGNLLRRHSHDRAAHERFVTSLMETFSPAFMAGAPRADHGSERPVFIVGMPRSGTSLAEQILASHPAVCGGGELLDIPGIVAAIPGGFKPPQAYPQGVTALTAQQCNRWASRYLETLQRLSADALRVTDKMPINFLHLGLIALLFPKARIIHCVRDPRDTCLSCYFQNFVGRANDFSYDLEDLGTYYRQYRRLMAHWKSVVDVPILEVVYEDLVADPETGTRGLLDFCGLEWDEQCLRFSENRRFVATASYDQVRRPVYRDSMQRWRHYESHLKPLVEALELNDGG